MADANVLSLQSAINRFAKVANFSNVRIDGLMGPETANGLLRSLNWIVSNFQGPEGSAAGELVAGLVNEDGSYNFAQMSASAGDLVSFLNTDADGAGLPTVNLAVVPSPSKSGIPSSPIIAAGFSPASIIAAWNGLPTWLKIGGGVALGLVALSVGKRVMDNRKRTGSGHHSFIDV